MGAIWEALTRPCFKRLVALLPHWLLIDYVNFFLPTLKLKREETAGAKTRR